MRGHNDNQLETCKSNQGPNQGEERWTLRFDGLSQPLKSFV
jgi:hypothetical protein